MGDYTLPEEKIQVVRVPTLLLDGGASFPWVQATAKAVVAHLLQGRHQTLAGQEHNFNAPVLAKALISFFQL